MAQNTNIPLQNGNYINYLKHSEETESTETQVPQDSRDSMMKTTEIPVQGHYPPPEMATQEETQGNLGNQGFPPLTYQAERSQEYGKEYDKLNPPVPPLSEQQGYHTAQQSPITGQDRQNIQEPIQEFAPPSYPEYPQGYHGTIPDYQDISPQALPTYQDFQGLQEYQEYQALQGYQDSPQNNGTYPEYPKNQQQQVDITNPPWKQSREIKELQGGNDGQGARESRDTQGVKHPQGMINPLAPEEVPPHQEIQKIQKMQKMQEMQEVPEHQKMQKMQEVSEHQEMQKMQKMQKMQEVPEHQKMQKMQEVPEHQEIKEIKETQEVPQAESNYTKPIPPGLFEATLVNYEITTPIVASVSIHGEVKLDQAMSYPAQAIKEIDPNADKLLKQIIDIMKQNNQITTHALNLFFCDVMGVKMEPATNTFYIASEDSLSISMLQDNYSKPLEDTLALLTGQNYKIKVLDKNMLSMPQHQIITEDGMHLFSTFTFDNFVVGNSNQIAHSYALKTAKKQHVDGENPFFLFGEPGCGKTHLSCAIANRKKELFPHLQIKYSTGSEWLEEFVNSLAHNKTQEFKQLYRNVDLLIIDDIQFLAQAESTLKELFDTFDTLKRYQKQIVFTSDRSPEELQRAGFPDRLTSRFYQGLVKKVESPDYDLRRAIIRAKAKVRGIDLHPNTEEIIATALCSNVRQLEGIINQIDAFVEFTRSTSPEVSMNEAMQYAQQEAIKNLVSDMLINNENILTAQRILEEVSRYYNFQPEQLIDKGRSASLVNARNVAVYLMHTQMGLTYKKIGDELGGRDHTTILNSLNKIRGQISEGNTAIQKAIQIITHRLESNGLT